MNTEENISDLAAIPAVYSLLGRLWLQEIDLTLLKQLCTEPLKSFYQEAGGLLPDRVDSEIVEQLATEYCKLCIGPQQPLSPYQSAWTKGQFQAAPADSMRRYLEVAQIENGKIMADHLGLQLKAMGVFLSAYSLSNDPEEQIDQLCYAFFESHLTWPTQMLKVALQRTESEFYSGLIQVTQAFLEEETAVRL